MILEGTVKFWDVNKKYGFIFHDGIGYDFVFYQSGLTDKTFDFKKGDDVTFYVPDNSDFYKNRRIKAFKVRKIYNTLTGTVKSYKEGFGCIIADDTKIEYTFHSLKLAGCKSVNAGDRVEFEPSDSPRTIVEGVVRLLKPQ